MADAFSVRRHSGPRLMPTQAASATKQNEGGVRVVSSIETIGTQR